MSSPHVWIPVGTALLLQIDDADKELSDWAIENTPVFGSANNAADASDMFKSSSMAIFGATALATPSGNQPNEWALSKLKGIGVQSIALGLTEGTTTMLKTTTERTRPNEADDRSFLSGHASTTAARCMLAYKNTDHLQIPGWSKTALKTGCVIIPYGTGWARVESENHYPSDVLIGIALGNFFGAFINDAFIGIDSADELQVKLDYLADDTITIGLSRRF